MGAVPGPLARGLARSMLALSAWLDRRAETIVRAAPQPEPEPLDALRRRYPGAPEAWLRQIAARLGTRPLPAADMPGAAVPQQDPPAPRSRPQPVSAERAPAPPDPGPAPRQPAACRDWPRAIAQAADTVLPLTRPTPPARSQPVFASADGFIPAPVPPAFSAAPHRAAPALPRFSPPVMSPASQAAPRPAMTSSDCPPPGTRPTLPPSTAPDPAWPVAVMHDAAPPLSLQPPPTIASPPAVFPAPPQRPAARALHLSVPAPGTPPSTPSFATPPPDRPASADWPATNPPAAPVPAPFARSPDQALWPALPPCDDGPASADPESAMPSRWAAPRPDQEARFWNG